MCFASSIAESHKKLFIASSASVASAAAITNSTSSVRNSQSARHSSAAKTEKKDKNTAKSSKMLRSKSRLQTEVCGDCGASDPSWASINRGILLCSDCCSVHRSLGRHISIVKSLRQGNWEPSVLNFVNSLNAHGANSVWEHHLLDGTPSSGTGKGSTRMRKPNAKDPLHPTKSDFIKAKHINLAFVLKPNLQDDDDNITGSNLEQELSKQLHASVRTSNLETSLRLLVQGADPNFFHEEKGSTPLHVAAKFGQASQIELLIVYGADINAIDGNGLTPLEVARVNNHHTIADRLMDAMYDVTDRIIMFLGGKKPDHTTGRHLIIPEINNAEISEQLKIARGRLQLVPNKMFEELVMDLYDEVDRRENEAIWATTTLNGENVAVPFLPANPFLSATRNQGRQKLARFSRNEFAGLLTDVLIDARRRQNMANLRPLDATSPGNNRAYNASFTAGVDHDPNLSDDEPIYDPVASDEDYAPVPPIAQQGPSKPALPLLQLETLRKQISDYESEINQLKNVVQKLSSENTELKSKFSSSHPSAGSATGSCYDEPLRIDLNGTENEHEQQSVSATDPGNNGVTSPVVAGSVGSSSTSSSATNSNQSTIKRPASMYERRAVATLAKPNTENRATTSMYQMPPATAITTTTAATATRGGISLNGEEVILLREEVGHRTELITRRLKELIMAMQDVNANKEGLVPCAQRIRPTVNDLIAFFAASSHYNDTIRDSLKQLSRFNIRIQHECENLQNAYKAENKTDIELYVKEVRDCAYYIASAIKTLVVQFD